MNHDQPRPKITVEDLLRVKRAERPPAEFWVRFEQELRAKQLAAIVEKRPWWHAASRVLAGTARLHLPLGATAVLALSIFVVREYRRPAEGLETAGSTVTPAAMPVAGNKSIETLPVTVQASAVKPGGAGQATGEPMVVSNVRPGEIAQVISMLGADSPANSTQRDPTPSARFIAANRAMAQMIEPDVMDRFANARGFETRALPARPVESEPLAQMSTPKDRMSERYLARALPVGYALEASAARPAETVRSRVKERQLLDDSTGSRFAYDSGSFNLKLF